MMTNTDNPFEPAIMLAGKLRASFAGAPGSGKTFSMLRLATTLIGGVEEFGENGRLVRVLLERRLDGPTFPKFPDLHYAKVLYIDTENNSARKYGRQFVTKAGLPAYDVYELAKFKNEDGAIAPQHFINAIQQAAHFGYELIIVDSLSHAWEGVLNKKDQLEKARKKSGDVNSFTLWKEITPEHNLLIDSLLDYPGHVMTGMRVKVERVLEPNPATDGKTLRVVTKGLKSIQRDGVEHEFDLCFDMQGDNACVVAKSRCYEIPNGSEFTLLGGQEARTISAWLASGEIREKPMTREEFAQKVTTLGIDKDKIGATLKKHGLNTGDNNLNAYKYSDAFVVLHTIYGENEATPASA